VVTDPLALAAAREALELELVRIDGACSRFRCDSELSRLNAAAGRVVTVGDALLEAVMVAVRAAESTSGLVDPTIGRSLRLAGYDRSFEQVRCGPRAAPRFVRVPGWRSVEVDSVSRTISIPSGVELDLGATAKALAADRAASSASRAAGCGVLVSLGGDISVAGTAPPAGWSVLVADDHADLDADGPVIAIRSGGLATSGTAVRRWGSGGAELHHIVDPRTGRPAATPWRTVSVAAASSVDANVASTAAVVIGDAAPEWLVERGLPARLVSVTGESLCVAGWPADREEAA